MGPAGEPPMKARVVNENDGIGSLIAEVSIRAEEQFDENVDVEEDAQEPHHRQTAERIEQASTGLLHPFARRVTARQACEHRLGEIVRPMTERLERLVGEVQHVAGG